jgi:multidrug resistance efflux pump
MAVFKIFRIPVNQWSLSSAALIGIIGIFLLILAMSYNHPFTANARIYYAVTPIFPTVKGRVIEVPIEANTLKDGDVLFRIDPKPYQYVVDEKKAALVEAEQKVDQLKQALDKATAEARRGLMRSASWRRTTMIARSIWSNVTLPLKQLSTPPKETWTLQNSPLLQPKPKRRAREPPMRRTSTA